MADYKLMTEQLRAVAEGVKYRGSNLANASAILFYGMEDVNWAGFYLLIDGKLRLDAFQGKVACTEIAIGKGVCGTAIAEEKIQRVENVHEFKGHIACDSASNSEIVLPIYKDGKISGVLDIDSPLFGRFTKEDEDGLVMFVNELQNHI